MFVVSITVSSQLARSRPTYYAHKQLQRQPERVSKRKKQMLSWRYLFDKITCLFMGQGEYGNNCYLTATKLSTVKWLMFNTVIQVARHYKACKTTVTGEQQYKPLNLVNRQLLAEQPNYSGWVILRMVYSEFSTSKDCSNEPRVYLKFINNWTGIQLVYDVIW